MARKRNQSTFDDLIDIVALLPWWMGVALAAVSYFWLHSVASAPLPVATQPGQMGAMLSQAFYRSMASVGQYFLPFICLFGAVLSALGRRKRKQLLDDVNASPAVSALNEMSWQEFEMLVGEAFRRDGYAVAETGGGGADGGVDLVLRKGAEKFLVQCKQWRAYKVRVPTIRELYGVMVATGAAGGFVVTSGAFTQEARSFAEGRNIDLIDGARLKAFIGKVQSPSAAPQVVKPSAPSKTAEQSCPKCGSEMIRRTAKHGSNAGKAFWGCSNFPQCRGIVAID